MKAKMGTTEEDEMKAKRCEICKLRPVMTPTQKRAHGVIFDYCEPCLILAEDENTHSDYGHDVDGPESSEYDAAGTRVAGCWVCYPELDQTQAEYRERMGTSRLGIVMHVSPRVTGKSKASQVREQLDDAAVRVTTRKGITTLKVTAGDDDAVINWDEASGHLLNASTTIDGRTLKARNVAEVLRRLAEAS